MDDPIYCGWCGKASDEVRQMIAGNNASICNECVVHCAAIIVGQDDRFIEDVMTSAAYLASLLGKDAD